VSWLSKAKKPAMPEMAMRGFVKKISFEKSYVKE
jgi:hypothetical protein